MNSIKKPRTLLPLPSKGWNYDEYFREQLTKIKEKVENKPCKTALV